MMRWHHLGQPNSSSLLSLFFIVVVVVERFHKNLKTTKKNLVR